MCPHKVEPTVTYDLYATNFIARHRRIAIEQCIESLTHSCVCRDAFCRQSSCMRMKRVVIHTSICKRRVKGNCMICKQLIALCCYHAKNCKATRCWVPFCNTVKTKMRRYNLLSERVDEARGLARPGAAVPDPEESDAIDVNMAKPYSFEEGPSGSGGVSSDATDSGDEAGTDENRNRPPPPPAPQPSPQPPLTDDHSTDSAYSELDETAKPEAEEAQETVPEVTANTE